MFASCWKTFKFLFYYLLFLVGVLIKKNAYNYAFIHSFKHILCVCVCILEEGNFKCERRISIFIVLFFFFIFFYARTIYSPVA